MELVNYRKVEANDSLELEIEQSYSTSQHGNIIWDSTLVFIRYLAENYAKNIKNKVIIELGAGTGILGICLVKLGAAKVVITDLECALPLIQRNVDHNLNDEEKSRVSIKPFIWNSDPSTLISDKKPDLLIVCDCVYENVKLWKEMAISMFELTSHETDIILAQEFRYGKDMGFWEWIKPYFKYSRVPNKNLNERWQAEDIGVFHFQKTQANIKDMKNNFDEQTKN